MQIFKKIHYLLLGISFMLTSCNNKNLLPIPNIVSDTLTLSGIVIDERINRDKNPLNLEIIIYNPISDIKNIYKITTEKSGEFVLELPIGINPCFAIVRSDIGITLLIYLEKENKNFLELRFDKEGNRNAKLSNNTLLNSYDITEAANLFMEMELTYCEENNTLFVPLYDKSYDEYIHTVNQNINCRIKNILGKNNSISKPIKEYIKQEYRLTRFNGKLFHYSENMLDNYRNTNSKGFSDDYITPPEPGKHYYSFLKELKLNEKRNLYSTGAYNNTLDNILLNDTLAILEIKDIPIDIWIKKATSVLEDIVGFKKGYFYDQLAIRSYIRQFKDQTKPLTEVQKENIKHYFKSNNAVTEILLKENERIKELAKYQDKIIINSTPDKQNKLSFEEIISKYSGKLIIVDFWATWCKPCIEGIDKMKELKRDLYKKDIVFVYIANSSSPQNQWNKKIQGIGGEHYYITNEQWNSIFEKYGITFIPSILLFDKNGNLKKKTEGYPGNDEIQHQLDNILNINTQNIK